MKWVDNARVIPKVEPVPVGIGGGCYMATEVLPDIKHLLKQCLRQSRPLCLCIFWLATESHFSACMCSFLYQVLEAWNNISKNPCHIGTRLDSFNERQSHEIQEVGKKQKPYWCYPAVMSKLVGFGRCEILKQPQNFPVSQQFWQHLWTLQQFLQSCKFFLPETLQRTFILWISHDLYF